MLIEGYIGVTRHPERRLREHRISNENPHLAAAFKLYGDVITMRILMVGEEDYCYEVENKLRPTRKIGWNIAMGGEKPPSPLGKGGPNHHLSGTTRTEEQKEDARLRWLGNTICVGREPWN